MLKNPPADAGAAGDTSSNSASGKTSLEEYITTHSSILAWKKFHAQRILADCSPWGLKESDTAEHSTEQPYQMLRRGTRKLGKVRIPDLSLLKLLENKTPQGLKS